MFRATCTLGKAALVVIFSGLVGRGFFAAVRQIGSSLTELATLFCAVLWLIATADLAPANEIRDFSVVNGYGPINGPPTSNYPFFSPGGFAYDPYENPASLQGYITIDITAGVVMDLDLRIGGNTGLHFHGAGLQQQFPGTYYLESGGYGWRLQSLVFLRLGIETTTLVGFQGAPLTSSFDRGNLNDSSVSYVRAQYGPYYGVEGSRVWNLTDGQLVPRVPEPSSLALAGIGLVSLIGWRWRRLR